jgi:hypothetical protein
VAVPPLSVENCAVLKWRMQIAKLIVQINMCRCFVLLVLCQNIPSIPPSKKWLLSAGFECAKEWCVLSKWHAFWQIALLPINKSTSLLWQSMHVGRQNFFYATPDGLFRTLKTNKLCRINVHSVWYADTHTNRKNTAFIVLVSLFGDYCSALISAGALFSCCELLRIKKIFMCMWRRIWTTDSSFSHSFHRYQTHRAGYHWARYHLSDPHNVSARLV